MTPSRFLRRPVRPVRYRWRKHDFETCYVCKGSGAVVLPNGRDELGVSERCCVCAGTGRLVRERSA
jgi:DnaJ-class molecular chaperone